MKFDAMQLLEFSTYLAAGGPSWLAFSNMVLTEHIFALGNGVLLFQEEICLSIPTPTHTTKMFL
jgi:hypothetical protein